MNYTHYRLLLFASIATFGLSSSDSMLRGSVPIKDEIPRAHPRKRQLQKGSYCKLYRKDTVYEQHDHFEEQWMCKLPGEESSRIGLQYVDLVDKSYRLREAASEMPLVSGQHYLDVSGSIIEDNGTMQISETANLRFKSNGRKLQNASVNGSLKTLMIRIVDSNNVEPKDSMKKLKNALYKTNSLKSQMETCSYDKLQIEAFAGTTETGKEIKGGVTDLQVNYDISLADQNKSDFNNAIFQAVTSDFGDLQANKDIDLVLFCLPEQATSGIVTYHFAGTKFSFYSGEWCTSTSALMFNVGRTLGLQPSNSLSSKGDIVVYGDKTGMMGSVDKDSSSRCYNAAKSYQLGWYQDQTKTINPLEYRSPIFSIPEFTLNSVSSYGKNAADALIVLKLEQTEMHQDYYIGFSSASSTESDAHVDENKVAILRTEGENGEFGTSTKIASLYLGQHYIISNYNGKEGHNVAIRFAGLFEENAVIQVVDIEKDPETLLDDYNAAITSLGMPCSNYEIEITTDEYPGDTYWVISENGGKGRVYARSPLYSAPKTTTTSTVCLPHRTEKVSYKFQIFDKYGDGLIDGGSYKGYDPSGHLIFEGGPDFSSKEHLFGSLSLSETNPHNDPHTFLSDETSEDLIVAQQQERPKLCKNERKKIQWNGKTDSKKRSCNWIRHRNKCDTLLNGEPLWKLCPKACGKCNTKALRTE